MNNMVPVPDAKWLDFLKSGLPTFLGLAAFSASMVYCDRAGYLPMSLPPAALLGFWILGILSGWLAIFIMIEAGYRAAAVIIKKIAAKRAQKKLAKEQREAFIEYIPQLNEHERRTFEHLLHHDQRVFQNTSDCGLISNLFALGFVKMMVPQSGHVGYFNVSFQVCKPVWEVLTERKSEFSFRLPNAPRSRTEKHEPWRRNDNP